MVSDQKRIPVDRPSLWCSTIARFTSPLEAYEVLELSAGDHALLAPGWAGAAGLFDADPERLRAAQLEQRYTLSAGSDGPEAATGSRVQWN
jgi:hypothetical protein